MSRYFGQRKIQSWKPAQLFIVYDGRAIPWNHQPQEVKDMVIKRQNDFGDGKAFREQFFPCDTDGASIFVSCNSLKEAQSYKGEFGDMNCIYSYDIKGRELINEKFVEIL